MTTKVLIVEDDPTLIDLLKTALEGQGFTVYAALNGRDGLRQVYQVRPDLIILDVMMPDVSGWEVCQQVRRMCDTPIIMLTAKTDNEDKVRGLELGADDYVTKPFDLDELIARIHARLRRTVRGTEQDIVYRNNDLLVDLARCEVIVRGEKIEFTATEFRLLAYLVRNAGRLLTQRQLLIQVWGEEYADELGYLKTYIGHLRRKIERDPHHPQYIITERGLGYRFYGDR